MGNLVGVGGAGDAVRWLPPILEAALSRSATHRRQQRAFKQCLDASRLHLGSGSNAIPGWTNLDQRPSPGIVECDLTAPLSVHTASIGFIYSEHFVEHLDREAGRRLFAECLRALQPGGVMRISTPDLNTLLAMYGENRLDLWHEVGFKPANRCQMVNEGLRSWDHRHVYDFEDLSELLTECGFVSIQRVRWHESEHESLRNLERRPFCGDLIVEAAKP